jgi:S1-C subfamily serine protease
MFMQNNKQNIQQITQRIRMSDNMFKQLSDAMAEAINNLDGALVSVDGRRRMPATGIAYGKDVVVTAHHVVERDEEIYVTNGDGSPHLAQLIGRDPANDLAVLRVTDADFKPAPFAEDNQLQVGNLVLAVGYPAGQVQASLGAVSELGTEGMRGLGMEHGMKAKREMRGKHGRHGRGHPRRRMRRMMGRILAGGYIKTDVTMYPGFSGGALISGDGLVHGLNTSGFGRGASIAVPVTSIRQTVDTLLEHGRMRQGYLGVGIQPARLPESIAEELEQSMGLLVVSVEDGSPAQTAGIMVGDIITSMGDESVEQVDELMMMLNGAYVGQAVDVQLVRGGALQSVSVTIAERV